DFDERFTTYGRDALNELLRDGYVAQIGEQVRLMEVSRRQAKGRIQIFRLPQRTPTAMIEVLSPVHKTGDGFAEYRLKRRKTIRQKVHLVEFDFLLAGQRLPMGRALPRGDYYAFVARAERRPDCEVYTWTIRDPLPPIPIPMSEPDPDVILDLGPVFATAYQRGRYARLIDYSSPLTLVRKPEDRVWTEHLARRARR